MTSGKVWDYCGTR